MTKPEKLPEPSMEDILASIRKIIADDPVKADGGKEDAASHHTGANGVSNSRSPAPKAGASGITLSPPASNEIDSLLDDAVDDPPLARPTAASSTPPSGGPFASTAGQRSNALDVKKPPATPPAAGATAAQAARPGALPELKPSIDRPKADGAAGDRPAFPSLGGSLAARLSPAGPGPTGRAADLSRSTLPPALEELLAQRASSPDAIGGAPTGTEGPPLDLGAFIPGQPGVSGSAPTGSKAPGPGTAAAAPSQRRPGERNGEISPAVPAGAPVPKPSNDVKSQPPGLNPATSAPAPAAGPPPQTLKAAVPSGSAPAAVRPSPPTDRSTAGPQHPSDLKSRDVSVGATAMPADKSGPAVPRSSAIPPTATSASGTTPAPAAPSTAAPPPAPTPQPVVGAAQAKTLEDTLSEVLRPVVRQWVIENMPRIVQEVAKQEVAKLPKPDAD